MSNALVPAGLIMIYQYGWAFESLLGVLFIAIGATGYRIYKQKMSVPLINQDGDYLTYSPSSTKPETILMDSSARFTVRELSITAETMESVEDKFEVSLLEFNSDADWQLFINHLRSDPKITLLFEE